MKNRENIDFENTRRNDQIFMKLLAADINFFGGILEWRKRVGLCKENLGSFWDYENFEDNWEKANTYRKQLMGKLKEDYMAGKEFFDWLDGFIEKYKQYGINTTWKGPILRYIACGFYCPPHNKTHFFLDRDRNCVVIYLYSNNSLNDIKSDGPKIRDLQSKLKKCKKLRLKPEFSKNFSLYLKELSLPKEEIYANEVGGTAKPQLLTDLDKVGKLYQQENDIPTKTEEKKRANKLKVNRHRLKKIT